MAEFTWGVSRFKAVGAVVLGIDEFVPIARFNEAAFSTDRIAAVIKTADKVELSNLIDEDKRKIDLYSIITSPGSLPIPFVLQKGASSFDDNGFLKAAVDASLTGITIDPSGPFAVISESRFELAVTMTGNDKRKFYVDLFANDNNDANQGEAHDVFCGRIEIQVIPDVFTRYESDQLLDEIKFIKPLADARAPAEYAGNYCMAAAERGLSRLLGDTTNFYSVDKSHNRLNGVSFRGKTASDRGAHFDSLGFVESSLVFDAYQVHQDVLRATNQSNFSANCYSAVTLNTGSNLMQYLKGGIDGKPGFHVYYMSVSDGFHTLLLVVDNRSSGKETYAIYDQHGTTSSSGQFADIESGFAKQTSWTLLNFYMNTGFKYPCKATTRIWKIRRKQP